MKFSLNHFWVFIGFIFFSCLKEPYRASIYVNTRDANEIKATSVKLHADVQSPDAGEITDRGFYWTANDSAATVLKNKISLGPGSGEFTYMLKNLQAKIATQSGPMLLLDGKINTHFIEKSENRKIRNGVGINKNGDVFFAISEKEVTFYEFSSFFKEQLNCVQALYLDGEISKIYIGDKSKKDNLTNMKFGPILSISK